MSRKLELLAPGGDIEAIKAAVVAGANAVYCGLDAFNARNRASNLSMDELNGAIRLAHEYNCEVFLTLNVVILEHEIPVLVKLLNQVVNSGIDGIIVQDMGVFNLVNKHFPTLDIHASTQMTTHNEGQILFLHKIGASRVNLSRELNLPEITKLTALAHENNILTEVFVHGALCIAFSGQCYSSSVSVGNSGNRGRCSQACRDEYEETAAGNKYPLNLKDNSAYFDLPQLIEAKVDSLKIEGRIKGAHYVYTVTDTWRKQIDSFIESGELVGDDANLHKVFNRSFTNSFLTGKLTKDMFIDSPKDYSAKYALEESGALSEQKTEEVQKSLYDDKQALGATLADKIKGLNIDKADLAISITGVLGDKLIFSAQTAGREFIITSSSLLRPSKEAAITADLLTKRLRSFNNAAYILGPIDCTHLNAGLGIPFKELTAMKKELAFVLNGSIEIVPHTDVPKLAQNPKIEDVPKLSLLISDENDAHLCDVTNADIYFKIPESLKIGCDKYSEILLRNPRFIPWFPAVLIGKDYLEAVRILELSKPKSIVTNNSGIAYKAYEMGIEWIAGPLLNTTNSHALITMQEALDCKGAFISNEINRNQIRNIRRPKNFKLLYSIYHPILMMTSRQCFFQRTVGCKKKAIEDNCMLSCEKATTITNVKGISFAVDKQKGGYPSIYNHEQFLNLEAVRDFSGLFDEFFIDLTDIGSGSKEKLDKATLIQEFEKFLADETQTKAALHQMVEVKTNAQYVQGL
ncbi:U32 family peptidase [Lentisphaera profundi]|uniref:U32 family peptidase n=1 Tax=Lentisphaera profundi TaxID=1658616 RepID=A0ABY7W353_9BACT|nr:peptidase U32 family protein [Lentisphaera profundi]WDE99414.1 U32 family peptidase [Lentisphaera profundi]